MAKYTFLIFIFLCVIGVFFAFVVYNILLNIQLYLINKKIKFQINY